NIKSFQLILSRTSPVSDQPIFLEWDWVVYNKNSSDLIETVILAFATDPDALFANPRDKKEVATPNWLILVLLVIWGLFGVHYSFMPTYRKSLIRFFDNHKFFINDVMGRYIRVGKSSTFLFFHQGLVGG